MGIGDFISDITPDSVEDKIKDGVSWAGDRVEDAGNWTADRLDDVGWDSGADWVRDQSRSVANRMGADVDELDLGETDDKTKLVYGSASKLRSTAESLLAFQSSFDQVGDGLRGLDSSKLKGETADALRTAVAKQPPKWYTGADACGKAAGALETFADTVTWAQGRAQTAIDKWKAGTKASEDAADAHKKKVDDYNKAVDRYNAQPSDKRDPSTLPPCPASNFDDPGKSLMQEAQDILADARKQRNSAAETARSAIRAARDTAPKKPSYADQLKDGLDEVDVMKEHFTGGILKGTAGIVNFARGINPMDPYNITHPAEYLTSLDSLAAGLVTAANDPVGTGSKMLTDFMKDPSEGLGRLVPDILLTVGTGGGGAGVKAARLAEDAADAASGANRVRNLIDDAADGTHDRPDGARTTDGTDPVDLATGRMFLPQTDVHLPGLLPLLFTRRTESGNATGVFLGPSWTSTVDERLAVDAIGVVHVGADGLLLPYPHPVPGDPTRSTATGVHEILARETDGGYTLTDPVSGLVRAFAPPAGAEPGSDGTAWLERVIDRNGNTVTVERGPGGRPSALADSAGRRIVFGLDGDRIASLHLAGAGPDGVPLPLMAYGYEDGDLTSVTKPSGATTVFLYDERHRVVAWTDSNGHRYDYAYDDQDRVIAEGGEAGHVRITLAYGAPDPATGLRTTTLTTADGRVTRHEIGAHSRITATTDALGRTARFHHDADGNLVSRTDPLGATTRFEYDAEGRAVRIVRADGSEVRVERGESGLPVEVTGPDGTRTEYEYDRRGNLVLTVDPAGRTTRFGYDDRGRPVFVTDALGATTRVECDAAGLTTLVVEPSGGATRIERDGSGRPVRVTDPMGAATGYRWTADGLLARRTGPDGAEETWSWDGEGNCLSRTDAVGGTTRWEYTHFDLPIAVTGPDGARHELEHDHDLRLVGVTDPRGLRWTYEYDAVGEVARETDFDGRTLTYRTDAAGRLAQRTDGLGGTVSFERDVLGRVLAKEVDGRVTRYTYDAAGRLLEAVGPDGTLVNRYDRRGLLTAELVDGRPITYAYDALGRRVRRTTPTGHVTAYAYDADGLPARLTTGGRAVDFTHDAAGRELTRAFGPALVETSVWDDAGRLTGRHLGMGARTVAGRSWSYRADGRPVSVADRLGGTRTFDLDAAGRVTEVNSQGWSERYAYDASGDQTSAVWPERHPGAEATGERAYSGTSLVRAGGVHLTHDALGRVTRRQRTRLSRKPDAWTYEWDTENRLTAVTTPDGTRWRYRYDPLGRRTAKQRLGVDGEGVVEEVRFTWDGLTLCEQTVHHPGSPHVVALTWDHRDVVPLAQTERILTADSRQEEIDRRFYAIATDLTGAPAELVDEEGEIAWRTRTTLWGTTAWSRDSTAYIPLRFPGQYYDPETGLHHNCFRHYDPETGRYVSPDPLGLGPGPNPLAYVANPYTGCDPLGLMPKYTREERAAKRLDKVLDDIKQAASDGAIKKRFDYHGDSGHGFTDERVAEILKEPDAIYQASNGKFTFRQGEDVVIVDGPGIHQGQAITAYGPSGIKGDSGVSALGGKPTDVGAPVTDADITQGRIPGKTGFQPPAVQIR
ncbi:putative T7SS-secreted protein [Streptomyces sp. NPDC008150]|uniref:putative T7SS-secreted protein n=1 Tax=Streptomyces sp. NPDC008150 TaxID=3364816 RepID=UPI0036ED6FB0